MNKVYSKYFIGKIEQLVVEPETYRERISFFKYIEKTKDGYFMLCSLAGISSSEDFQLKIKINKKDYEKSKIGDDVSIHLNFEYHFVCFHYQKDKKETEI